MNARSQSAAMKGSGWYNRHSSMQAAGNDSAMVFWKDALEKIPIGEENIVIADYGCSQGRNSMKPMGIAIEALRRRAHAQRPIEIYHNDLPTNDFGSLFRVIADERDSYMAGHDDVFPAAIGRSYFEPILPPSSVHAGWNSWTMQWMSKNPADAPDHVFGMRERAIAELPSGREDPSAIEANADSPRIPVAGGIIAPMQGQASNVDGRSNRRRCS